MKFLSLLLFLFIVDIPLCQAYLIRVDGSMSATACENNNTTNFSNKYAVIKNLTFDSSEFTNISNGQYYQPAQSTTGSNYNEHYAFVTNCDNWGPPQAKTKMIMRVTSSNVYATIKESSIVGFNAESRGDLNDDVSLFTTNIPGAYYYFQFYGGNYGVPQFRFPAEAEGTDTFSSKGEINPVFMAKLVFSKEFRGVPDGKTIYSTAGEATLEWFDANEPGGGHTVNIHALFEYENTMNIVASCNYSLSDNGVVDFGDQNLSKVTSNRTTTVKKPLTLYMKDCYGVNKVKTYITNATTTLENGLLLGNTQTTNAATNVAIGINVAASSAKNSENNGSPMYMDGSNPLEWEFGNQYTVDVISKEIPLDVFLLSSGGEPTTGDFKATATIMMDFI